MKPEQQPREDFNHPVAYDSQGRPLYAHPPAPEQSPTPQQPQVVHLSRAVEPMTQTISPEILRKHQASKQRFGFLNLSTNEYVISAVRRHPIGLLIPVGTGIILIALILSALFNYGIIVEAFNLRGTAADVLAAAPSLLLLALLVGLGTYVAYYVYTNNKFFLTNESVIQEIQTSLFSRHEQTVSLANIEDASYQQHGIIQQIFDYGSIRLSTEGDETTYRFTYVSKPKQHIAQLNNAVEAFKNGRPVDDN
jgi:hypothetical protein